MTEFGLESFGFRETDAQLQQLAVNAETLAATAFPAIREDFQAVTARRFGDEGPGWDPLSATTIRLKERNGYAQPASPLLATGDLIYSLAGDTEHTVHEVKPDELVMGTKLPYAQYHQAGPRRISVFGRGSAILPERRIVDIDAETAHRWCEIIEAALMRGARTGPSVKLTRRGSLPSLGHSPLHIGHHDALHLAKSIGEHLREGWRHGSHGSHSR